MPKVSADQNESSTRKMIKSIDQQVARSFRVGKKNSSTNLSSRESDPINQIFPTLHQLPGAFLAEVSNGPATALVRRGVLFARFFGSFYRILDSNSITCIAFRATRTSQTYLPSADTVTWTWTRGVYNGWKKIWASWRRQQESRRQRKVSCFEHAHIDVGSYVAQVTLSRLLRL